MVLFSRYQPQLAIEDVGLSREAKEQRTDLLQAAILGGLTDGTEGDDSATTTTFTLGPDNTITSGPVIRDVTHDLNEGVAFATVPATIEQPKTPAGAAAAATSSTSALMAVDPKLVQAQQHQDSYIGWSGAGMQGSGGQASGSSSGAMQSPKNPNKRPVLTRELSREDMDEDINKVGNTKPIIQ